MATNDNRRVIQAADLDLQKVNTALAQISNWIMSLEGRSGSVKLRDSLLIKSEEQTLIDLDTLAGGKAAIAVFGTDNGTLAFAKGARKENNGEWVATDTVAVIWALDRAGSGILYANFGLAVGQAFTPTVASIIGTGGSYVLKTGDTMTGSLTTPGYISITGAADASGNLRFSAANPVIAATSYINVPKSFYISTATVPFYTEALIEARGGITNDTATYLKVGGGSGGGTDASFTVDTPYSTAPTVALYAKPIALSVTAGATQTDVTGVGTGGWSPIWDTTRFDTSGGKLSVLSPFGYASSGIYMAEPGYYRWSCQVTTINIPINTESIVFIIKYNATGTPLAFEATSRYTNTSATSNTTYYTHVLSGITQCTAVNDFLVVTTNIVGLESDDWNFFHIERLN